MATAEPLEQLPGLHAATQPPAVAAVAAAAAASAVVAAAVEVAAAAEVAAEALAGVPAARTELAAGPLAREPPQAAPPAETRHRAGSGVAAARQAPPARLPAWPALGGRHTCGANLSSWPHTLYVLLAQSLAKGCSGPWHTPKVAVRTGSPVKPRRGEQTWRSWTFSAPIMLQRLCILPEELSTQTDLGLLTVLGSRAAPPRVENPEPGQGPGGSACNSQRHTVLL